MQFFDNAYEGTPTWDIGRPQGVIVRLAAAGAIAGPVLDVGCGTGENSLHLASLGLDVTGIDLAHAAVDKARTKVATRPTPGRLEFLLWDALRAGDMGREFRTAIDVGLFHSLQPDQRTAYATSLRRALVPGGVVFIVCWSTRNPLGYGPERIARADIRASFRSGWSIEAIEDEFLETRLRVGRVHAWLARLRRT